MKKAANAYTVGLGLAALLGAGREHDTGAGAEPVGPGKATIRLDFAYDGGGLGKGATTTLSINGSKAAEGRIARTIPLAFSGDEGTDVGVDEATNVTDASKEGDDRFTGRIHKITIEVK